MANITNLPQNFFTLISEEALGLIIGFINVYEYNIRLICNILRKQKGITNSINIRGSKMYNNFVNILNLTYPAYIKQISIHYKRNVNNTADNTFQNFASLHNLQDIDISGSKISITNMQHLSNLIRLKKLSITNTEFTNDLEINSDTNSADIALQYIAKITNLLSLTIICSKITDYGLQYIAALENLIDFKIKYCHLITNNGLQSIFKLNKLNSFDCSKCAKIAASGLQNINKLINLQYLIYDHVDYNGLSVISKLRCISHLDITCNEDINDGLEYLSYLHNLLTLKITKFEGIIKCLNNLTNLQELVLQNCNIENLQNISELENLLKLDFIGWNRNVDNKMLPLNKLNKLQTLSLCYYYMQDSVIPSICPLYNLWKLDLSNCSQITDNSLELLTELPQLLILCINKCNTITNNGLQHVAKMKQLMGFGVQYGTRIKYEGIKYIMNLEKLVVIDLANCIYLRKPYELFKFGTDECSFKWIENDDLNLECTTLEDLEKWRSLCERESSDGIRRVILKTEQYMKNLF
jgi:hypothetical protein